ncbi:MAG: hypothetical protein ABI068_04515 [Ktedonobacterales bacterium]
MTHAPRIALITAPDLPDLSLDERVLLHELQRRGYDAQPVIWSDPAVNWRQMDLAIVRSAWDAVRRPAAFLAWLDTVAVQVTLLNPPALIRWNLHKRYLFDLAERGVPIVPTVLAPQAHPLSLARLCDERGWTNVVIKPAISASAFETFLVPAAHVAQGQRQLDALLLTHDMLIQPYLPTVVDVGERALVYIAGAFSHAGRKTPAITPTQPMGHDTITRERVEAASDERALADDVLATLPYPTLYARVDMLRDTTDRLLLMELEVIDPALYFGLCREAAPRLADALAARLPG